MRHLAAATIACVLVAAATTSAHEGHATGPHPTSTAAAAPTAGGSGAPLPPQPMLFRVRSDARADLGWTGISHGQEWPADQRIGFAAVCKVGDDTCAAAGGKAGDFFGSPIPLASGGVPACVVNRLREGVTGTVQPRLGCAQLHLALDATVFTGADLIHPCPVCRDDPTPNDGKREGTCAGGATDGAACDAHGITRLFGAVSTDCLPAPSLNVGELVLDLPLTTGDATMRAGLTCKMTAGKDTPPCFCPAQVQASACVGGDCDDHEKCSDGPIDRTCSTAPGRGCAPGSGTADCEATLPGSGECVTRLRTCFRPTLPVTGTCDLERPTYAAAFCVPATRAAALNAAAGLPGAARIVLPLERLKPAK